MEFLLGYKRTEVLQYLKAEWPGYDRVERRLREPSIIDHFYDFLAHRGIEIPEALRDDDPTAPNRADATVQRGVLQLYKNEPETAILFELMTDVDEGLQEWRYRHVKMVERTIGNKHGTGGSPGVDFLKRGLFHPVFPDLWAIRHEL